MARKAERAAAVVAERQERELNTAVNEAIARTEDEIFAEALGDEPADDSADTSLEEMGEGLEGDELDEEDEADEDAGDADDEEGDEGEEPAEDEVAGDEAEEGEADAEDQPRDQRGRPETDERQGIPPRVLANMRGRSREAEAENERLQSQLRDMQARLDNFMLQAGRQQPPQQQQTSEPKQPPDMFADPEGYRQWVLDEAERRAEKRVSERFQSFQAEQRQQQEQRLNASFETAARGPRGYEFNVAYQDFISELSGMPVGPTRDALLRTVTEAPNQGQAVIEWWERTSNPDYIEYHREQVRQTYASQEQMRPSRGQGGRQTSSRQQQPAPRHEVRLPRSLNSAVGGGRQHMADPETLDGSDSSIFGFATRR